MEDINLENALTQLNYVDEYGQPLLEMAYKRSHAISHCYNLSKPFVEHFIKICEDGINHKDFNHHCAEMTSWWDAVRSIRIKDNNKRISNTNLTDWFFTRGSDPEDFIPEPYQEYYDRFYADLLSKRDVGNIKDILQEILK